MSIKGSAKPAFKLLQIMQSTPDFIDEQRNADMLDALADIAHEQEQAMRESEQSEWSLVDRTDGIINVDLINEHLSNDHQREQWDETDEDLDAPYHWSATMATKYSSDDETAMAAFNYPSDSSETDRWR